MKQSEQKPCLRCLPVDAYKYYFASEDTRRIHKEECVCSCHVPVMKHTKEANKKVCNCQWDFGDMKCPHPSHKKKEECSCHWDKNWEKEILSLSETTGSSWTNKVMAFPWNHKYNKHGEGIVPEGYVCLCDDGFLCEHRARWIIKFISSLLMKERQKIIKEARYAIGSNEAMNHAHITVLKNQIKELKSKFKKE